MVGCEGPVVGLRWHSAGGEEFLAAVFYAPFSVRRVEGCSGAAEECVGAGFGAFGEVPGLAWGPGPDGALGVFLVQGVVFGGCGVRKGVV